MKVAYLLGSLNQGGAENLVLDVIKNAAKSKFEFIGLSRKGGFYESDFLNYGQTFFCGPKNHKKLLSYLIKLRKILINNGITIVHAQQPIDAVLAKVATLGVGIKIVLTVHSYDKCRLNAIIKKLGLFMCDHACFVSRFQYDHYKELYQLKENSAKYSILYNGIDLCKLIRKKECLNNNKFQMGFVGSFRSVRNQFFVCKFLKYLKDKGTDFDFFFIGSKIESEADLYDECVDYCSQNNLNSNVHFLGGCDNVPELLAKLDAFVYCSDHDTFGIAVIEAIASGVPTFVNDWEAMKEVTEDGKFATIYKTGSVEDLYEKFMVMVNNPEKAFQEAKERAKLVREKYSIETHMDKLYELYKSL